MMRQTYLGFLLIASSGALFAQTPVVSAGGVVNAATFQNEAVAPGSLISIFGTDLSSNTAAADSVPLATSMGGVTVTFSNGGQTFEAPLLYVQKGDPSKQVSAQINAQVPWNILPGGSPGTVNLIVTRDNVASQPIPIQVNAVSPGVFSSNGKAIVANTDGTFTWPVGAVPGAASHPAKPGDVVILYATGLGAVDSPDANGAASLDKLRNTVQKPIVMIGGVSAQILFSGLSPQFVGVNQLNVVIPNITPSDTVPVQIQVGGMNSPSGMIAVTQ